MDAFLKAILEPSEQDTFDHLTRMEPPSLNTFRSPCAGKGCSGGASFRGDGQVLLAGNRAGMDGWRMLCVHLQHRNFPQAGFLLGVSYFSA